MRSSTLRPLLAASFLSFCGFALGACFGSSSSGGGNGASFDAGFDTSADFDGSGGDGSGGMDATTSPDAPSDGGGGADSTRPSDGSTVPPGDAGGDVQAEAEAGACPVSTCKGVEVVFYGWIQGGDGGNQSVEIAVDDAVMDGDGGSNGTIWLSTAAPTAAPTANVLVGDFATDSDGGVSLPPVYVNDNNACNVPDFGGRTNEYYLASMQGLPISPGWQNACPCGGNCGGACGDAGQPYLCDDFSGFYSQSCPNFGFNCVSTPGRIEQIQVLSTAGSDSSCEVCFYSSTTPSAASAITCAPIGATLNLTTGQLATGDGGTAAPALVRLDDGSGCKYY